ncbi:ESPR-type extended signal peptide-containing protein [Ursidibacter sp. B-7004-1]
MNKVFKVIWNYSTQSWVAVSELAKGHAKSSSSSDDTTQHNISPIPFAGSAVVVAVLTSIMVPEAYANHLATAGGIANGNGNTPYSDYKTPNAPNNNAAGFSLAAGYQATANNGGTALGAYAKADRGIAVGSVANASAVGSIAIGQVANASAQNSIALGRQAGASGTHSFAAVSTASASGESSIAVGKSATATGKRGIAIGANQNTDATYNNATSAVASGEDSIALGSKAKATKDNAIALGEDAKAQETNATAIGNGALANKADTIAFGSGAGARGDSAVSVGKGSSANATNSTAIGVGAKATGDNSTAIGLGTQAKNENALAIGTNSTADNKNTVAIGYGAKATNEGAFAFGSNVSSKSNGSLGLGTDSVAWGNDSIAIGTSAKTNGGANAISIGKDAYANGKDSVAFGAGSNVTKERGSAFGANTTADRWASAFGSNATANASRAVAVGEGATASKDNAVAIGNATNSSGASAVALGNKAEASGSNSVALGNGSTASASNALAFGNGANASTANSVALGDGATTATAGTVSALNFNKADGTNNPITVTGTTGVTGTVSVGKSGALRQIQNVAAGRVTATSTDAVNGSQLYTVMENVGFNIYENAAAKSRIDNNNKVTFADGDFTKANVTGASDATVKFNVVTQDITSTEATQITAPTGTAGLAKAADVVKAINNAGFTLKANNDTGEKITNGDSVSINQGKNIEVTRSGSDITIKTADEVEFTSTKAGALTATSATVNGPTTLNGTATVKDKLTAEKGATISGGLDMNNSKITGLQEGSDNTDAVNVGQLNSKVDAAKTELTNKGLKFKGETADEIHKNLGETLEIVGKGNNINTTNTDGKIEISISDTPTFTNITTNNGATIKGGDLVMSDQGITSLKSGGDTDTNAANIGDVKRIAKGLATIVTSDDNSVTVTPKGTDQKTYDLSVNTTKLAENVKLQYTGDNSSSGENTLSTAVNFAGTAGEIVTKAENGKVGFSLAKEIKDKINQSADDIATKGLTFTGNTGSTNVRKLGDTLNISGTNSNIQTNATGENVTITLSNTLNLTDAGSVNFGDNKAKLDKDGLTIPTGTDNDKVSVTKDGINAGNKTIGGVANGTKDDDAVNLAQLNETKAIAEKGWNVTIAKGEGEATAPAQETKVAPGETVTYTAGKNVKLEIDGKNITVSTTDKVNFSEVTATKVDAKDVNTTNVTAAKVDATDVNATNVTAAKVDATNVNATNVNATKVNATDVNTTNVTSTGEANLADLTATGNTKLGGTDKSFTIENGTAVNMGDNVVKGVAEGSADTDAVNVKQLKDAVNASGWKLKVNDETDDKAEKVANDEAVTFAQGDNIVITRDGKTVTVATSKTPTFDTLKTTGKAEVGGELAVTGPATFTDKVTANKGLDVNGPTVLNGTTTVKDKLTAEKGASISEGLDMNNSQITNVAAGTADNHAVNKGQLESVNSTATTANSTANTALETANKGWNVTIAKGEGEATAPAQETKVAPGETVTYTAGKNVKLEIAGKNITVSTTDNVNFTNVTAAKVDATDVNATNVNATKVNATDVNTTNVTSTGKANLNDLTVTGNTTIGGEGKTFAIAGKTSVDMGSNVVSNVAAGEADTDAVNVNQLKESGWKLKINDEADTDAEKVNPDEVVTFKQGDNIVITREGQNVTVATSQTPTFTNLTTTEGANIGGDLNVSGSTTLGDTNVGGKGNTFAVKEGTKVDMGGNKISNVANGDISPNSTDAVNGRQIFALTGGQGAPDVAANYTTTITNPDGSTTTLEHKNVVVDENGKPLLVTYNVQDQKEHVTNSVITAINHMNTQGIKFFHTNDGTAKSERPEDQSENNEDSSASGAYATAVGYRATASGERAIAFGYNSTVTGTDSISVGTGNIVNGNNSGAFGDPSIIDADKSYSIGNDNRIAQGQSDVFVLGNNVTKTESNSVFLGSQSGYVAEGETTKGNSAHTSQTIGGETYQYAGGEASQVKGVVSVGNVAQDGTMETRRIQNVAPGLVSETSTDAINGSQLYSLHSVVDKGWNLTSGTVEGSNGVSNQSAPAKVGMGETVRVNAGQNIVVNQNGRTLDIATTMAPTFNSLKVNPNGKVDMGGNRIQNVGQAINAGDAVNYGQLKAELGKVDNRLRSGVAGAVASASLVQAFNPSESMLAVGGGTYRGASALAVGYSKVSDNGRIIIKVTGSANNQGDYTGGASVGFKF